MKAILEFDLPDDETEFNFATKGSEYYLTLWDLDQWLRAKIKYDDTLHEKEYEAYEKSREQLREIMNNNGITFND
jgi:hypothetical protein